MKKTLLTAVGCALLHPLMAQNHVDALRYSATRFGSTARNLSLGGAFGAIGADASVMNINPAGLGQYRASEFTFGLGAHSNRNSSAYQGSSMESPVFNLSLPNLCYVGTQLLRTESDAREGGWQSFSVGIGLNRLNNYWREMQYEGVNKSSSITHYFADRAYGIPEADLSINSIEGLAYNTYLINPSGAQTYSSAISDSAVNVLQEGQLRSEGNMNEYNLAIGGNYNNRFYVGIGVFVTTIRHSSSELYSETDNGMNDNFRSLEFLTRVNTSGTGLGLRGGFLFRASDMLRLGASLQSPTLLNLYDEYDYSMRSGFDTSNPSSYYFESDALSYSYKISTPLRGTLSAALLFAKKGLLSADVEFIDYSRAKLSSLEDPFKAANKAIADYYKSSINIRLGGEYVYEVFRFRAGFAFYGSPYSSQFTVAGAKAAQKSFCAGIGYRAATYFIDLGYMYSISEDYYTPYPQAGGREVYTVVNKLASNNIVMTAGFRFE